MSDTAVDTFLQEDATSQERWRALHQSVQSYYLQRAQVGANSHIGRLGDLVWTSSRVCVESEESLGDSHAIDYMLAWYGSQRPLQGALWWYMSPGTPLKLQARLYARGFAPSFRPHWMCCDLGKVQPSPLMDHNFTIRVATAEDYLASADGEDEVAQALSTVVPRRVFHLIACRGDARLGKCILNISTGELGIGILFDMIVIGNERRKGVGKALVRAACEMAINMGCRLVMLNATEMGESVYRRAGFRSMGLTYTWDLNTNVLADNAPSDLQVKFLEAVGLGDVEALQSMSESLESGQLHDPTLNGLTPFEIAAQCQQPKSATWLLDQGVVPDIISVWDLGWKDRGSSLLAKHPEIVQREISPFAETPLHVAVERNDLDLAKLLLTVPNNMDAKDSRFRSTPVGWARHLNRPEMLSLLEKHTDTQSPASIHDALESILGKEQIREVLVNMANEA